MFNVIQIVETFIAFVLALVLHEYAHASMAALLGDGAPASRARLTLAPRRHMAAIGTISAIVFAVSGIGLGWGKPLESDARRLRVGANVGLILVALAGPLLNLILGVGITLGLRYVPDYQQLNVASLKCGGFGSELQTCLSVISNQSAAVLRVEQFLFIFAITNILLAIFNLVPLHPLDGYHILFALLPNGQAITYRNWAPYMEMILLAIFFVLPVLFQTAHIPFPQLGAIFYSLAGSIADSVSGGVFARFVPLL